jgi:hypothetical protein
LYNKIHLSTPAAYRSLLNTVISAPQKARQIQHLRLGRRYGRGFRDCKCRCSLVHSPQDVAQLATMANELGLSATHSLQTVLITPAEEAGALLLFLLHHLPVLQSIRIRNDYCEVQHAIEWCLRAPPCSPITEVLHRTIRSVTLGDPNFDKHLLYGPDEEPLQHPLQNAIPWLFVEGLQAVR